MIELLIQIADLPVDGREFSFDEQRIWTDPIAEFGLPYRVSVPFSANLRILRQQDGCVVDGTMRGSLIMPCDRCVEEFAYHVDATFCEFEAFPAGKEASPDDVWWIVTKDGVHYLNAAGFLWEQFLLALPEKPLCKILCRGVCPACGTNKNVASCECHKSAADSRLSVFRSMNIS